MTIDTRNLIPRRMTEHTVGSRFRNDLDADTQAESDTAMSNTEPVSTGLTMSLELERYLEHSLSRKTHVDYLQQVVEELGPDIAHAYELRRQGLSYRQIGAKQGCSAPTAMHRVRKANTWVWPDTRRDGDEDETPEGRLASLATRNPRAYQAGLLRLHGWSSTVVADLLGVSVATVRTDARAFEDAGGDDDWDKLAGHVRRALSRETIISPDSVAQSQKSA